MSSGSTQSSASVTDPSGSTGGGTEAARSLLQLSRSDVEIQVLKNRIQDIEQQQRLAQQDLAERRAVLAKADASAADAAGRQAEEEERLRVEQRKIVERRKHLSSIGGTRGAKLMEREIDISARTVQQMEQKVLSMLEETEQLKNNAARLRSELELKQLECESALPESEQITGECKARLAMLEERRSRAVAALEERVRTLYVRVSGRYPGGAIALADAGACRSCYRSLPAQTFNQIIAGSVLLQCPGCSRILLPAGLAAEDGGADV